MVYSHDIYIDYIDFALSYESLQTHLLRDDLKMKSVCSDISEGSKLYHFVW